jgi:hypothetical protein
MRNTENAAGQARSEARADRVHVSRDGRRRRVRVRVQTDVETYIASLQVPRRRGSLSDVLNDGRAYLALWDATLAGSSKTEDFVAIHKAAIRSIVLLERPGSRGAASAAASLQG